MMSESRPQRIKQDIKMYQQETLLPHQSQAHYRVIKRKSLWQNDEMEMLKARDLTVLLS